MSAGEISRLVQVVASVQFCSSAEDLLPMIFAHVTPRSALTSCNSLLIPQVDICPRKSAACPENREALIPLALLFVLVISLLQMLSLLIPHIDDRAKATRRQVPLLHAYFLFATLITSPRIFRRLMSERRRPAARYRRPRAGSSAPNLLPLLSADVIRLVWADVT